MLYNFLISINTLAGFLLGGYIFNRARSWKRGFLWSILFYLLASTLILINSTVFLLIAAFVVLQTDDRHPLRLIDAAIAESVILAIIGPGFGSWLLRLIKKRRRRLEDP
jgi:ABC-type glycerol-3-phosphate transport system permease component